MDGKRDQNQQVSQETCGLAPPWPSLHAATRLRGESDAVFGIRYLFSCHFSILMLKVVNCAHVKRPTKKRINNKTHARLGQHNANVIPTIMSSKTRQNQPLTSENDISHQAEGHTKPASIKRERMKAVPTQIPAPSNVHALDRPIITSP